MNMTISPSEDFLTTCHKRDDKSFRDLKIQPGDWVNFRDEFGDVWHQVIKTYEPENFYATVYYWGRVGNTMESTDASRYYYNIRKIARSLPANARIAYSEEGKKYPGV